MRLDELDRAESGDGGAHCAVADGLLAFRILFCLASYLVGIFFMVGQGDQYLYVEQ
jgi:hypothetical protein